MAVIDDLVSYWALDEASGNAVDSHGSNALSETSGTIPSASGLVGGARDFEAADSEFFEGASNASLQTGDIDFMFAGWVWAESLGNNRIVVKSNSALTELEYQLWHRSSVNTLQFQVFNGAGTTRGTANWSSGVSTSTWYFVVAWHDSVNNLVGIQVNNGTPVTASTGGAVGTNTHSVVLGNHAGGSTGWDGLIDEFGFWKRVLTADERTWLYNSGAGRSYADIVAESATGQPTMRRWGGVPFVGGQGIGNKGFGRAFGRAIY